MSKPVDSVPPGLMGRVSSLPGAGLIAIAPSAEDGGEGAEGYEHGQGTTAIVRDLAAARVGRGSTRGGGAGARGGGVATGIAIARLRRAGSAIVARGGGQLSGIGLLFTAGLKDVRT